MKYSLLTFLGLVWLATAQAGDPKPITVTAGKEFKITLQYNTSTGYQWVFATPPDEKLVKLLRTEYKQLDTKRVGAGGDMVWTFQALAEGKTKLELNCIRPWENKQKPAQTTNFVVIIKAPKSPAKKKAPAPTS